MNIVVLISANAEWRVVKEIYPDVIINHSPFGEWFDLQVANLVVKIFHGGWGKISAAATAQYVIDHFVPDLLINLGTCGGFVGRIETGTIILVEKTIVYDILEQMGDGAEAIAHYSTLIDLSWLENKLSDLPAVIRGQMVSADRDIVVEDIPMLVEKYHAVAADWESGAIAWVARRNNIRALILRGVSDLVGAEGGEAYGNLELFHQRTKTVMLTLFEILKTFLMRL